MQCMATAMTAGTAATGLRSFIVSRHFAWVTPERMRRITVALLAIALFASAVLVGGSSAPVHPPH